MLLENATDDLNKNLIPFTWINNVMYTYLRILVTSSQVLICPCGVRRVARAFSSWCGSTAHESPLACNDNKGTKEIINYGEILQQLLLVNLK